MKTAAIALCVFLSLARSVTAADLDDFAQIGSAYLTSLAMHEIGHQAAATRSGASGSRMQFFTFINNQFFPGLSTYAQGPESGRLPFAAGGFAMDNQVFNYGLALNQARPTTYNKALIFFSATDFLLYTAYANYIKPDDPWLDSNQIRQQTGLSKSELLGLAALNTLCNAYRINHKPEKYDLQPVISTTRDSVFIGVLIQF